MKTPEAAPELSLGGKITVDLSVRQQAKELNGRYLHWDDLQEMDCGSTSREALWTFMKVLRAGTALVLELSDTRFEYNLTGESRSILHELDASLAKGLMPAAIGERRRPMYATGSIMEESIASARISGHPCDPKETKRMLRNRERPADMQQQAAVNEYEALLYVRNRLDEPLDMDLLREVNATIMRSLRSDVTKWFEEEDIVTLQCPRSQMDHTGVESALEDLFVFVNEADRSTHPMVKAVILHFALCYLHPFPDGNGRTARAMFYWCALREGYDFMDYLAVSKAVEETYDGYIGSFLRSETDGNDITYFIDYSLRSIRRSMDIFTEYLDRRIKEQDESLKDVRVYGFNTRQGELLAELKASAYPLSVYDLSAKYRTSEQNIRRDLLRLADCGFVSICGREGHRTTYAYSGKE